MSWSGASGPSTSKRRKWGDDRITSELKKLGYRISHETVRQILRRHGILPVPHRKSSSTWRTFLNHYKDTLLACDFFTVEPLRLQTLYVFFFIEVGTRRIHIVDVTAHPTQVWVIQQARQFVWNLPEQQQRFTHLIRDNDDKYQVADESDDAICSEASFMTTTEPLDSRETWRG